LRPSHQELKETLSSSLWWVELCYLRRRIQPKHTAAVNLRSTATQMFNPVLLTRQLQWREMFLFAAAREDVRASVGLLGSVCHRRAGYAVLRNGQRLHVTSYGRLGDTGRLDLPSGGVALSPRLAARKTDPFTGLWRLNVKQSDKLLPS
jgi:hypothetical protein